MQRKFRLLTGLLLLLTGSTATPALPSEKLEVVASFSIIADFVREIGGERVSVTALVGPDSDAHVYEPTPADVKKVTAAGVIVVNGLGLEGWLNRLLEASGARAPVVEASADITALPSGGQEGSGEHEHGALDPHAFQSISNAMIYVGNISVALCRAAPKDCAAFKANAQAYTAKLRALDKEVRTSVEKVPADKRRIITSHDAFGYFAMPTVSTSSHRRAFRPTRRLRRRMSLNSFSRSGGRKPRPCSWKTSATRG